MSGLSNLRGVRVAPTTLIKTASPSHCWRLDQVQSVKMKGGQAGLTI